MTADNALGAVEGGGVLVEAEEGVSDDVDVVVDWARPDASRLSVSKAKPSQMTNLEDRFKRLPPFTCEQSSRDHGAVPNTGIHCRTTL
jgi:hypothetical protein